MARPRAGRAFQIGLTELRRAAEDARTATNIVTHTIKGAAELILERKTHPEQEIDKVTTPRGCTIAGLNEKEHNGFSSPLIKGIVTSFEEIR